MGKQLSPTSLELTMKDTRISMPALILIAGTRAALGAGLGLLLADRLSQEQRRAVGWTLFLLGALSTIPLAFEVGSHRVTSQGGSDDKFRQGRVDVEIAG
jgi:hypothetical protein